MVNDQNKNELTTSTALTQDPFEWEPDIASVPATGDDNPRPPRSMKGELFTKFVWPEAWTAGGMPATGRTVLLHDIHYEILRWPTDAERRQNPDMKGPAEVIPVERGAPEPDLKALNAGVPQELWPMAFGKQVPPYRVQRVCEFFDLSSMDTLSWPVYVGVAGASIAVDEVRKRINMIRRLRGEELFAVVKLNHRPFTNTFNPKLERPWLEIAGWARLGPNGVEMVDVSQPKLPPQAAAESTRTINAEPVTPKPIEPKPIKPSPVDVPLSEEAEDSVPWK
jgi:hypothetical protein